MDFKYHDVLSAYQRDINSLIKNLPEGEINKNEIKNKTNEYFGKILNQNFLEKQERKLGEINNYFKGEIEKNRDFLNEIKKAVETEEVSKLKDFLSNYGKNKVLNIKQDDLFKNFFNQKPISDLREEANKIYTHSINDAINRFNSTFSGFINVSLQGEEPTVSLNVINLSELAAAYFPKVKEAKIGEVSLFSFLNVLKENNINEINLSKSIYKGLKSKSIFDQSNALNSALRRKIIDPREDPKVAGNLILAALCTPREKFPISKEEKEVGNSSISFQKSSSVFLKGFEAYNFSIVFNYAPLRGAGGVMELRGTAVKFNIPYELQLHQIQKGLSINANFSFGAAFVKGNFVGYIGDYKKELFSFDDKMPIIPIGSLKTGFEYTMNNISLFGGVTFLPGVETYIDKKNNLGIMPGIQRVVNVGFSTKFDFKIPTSK